MVPLGRLRRLTSGPSFISPPRLFDSLIGLRRLRMGDDGREVAGENTPTPDSLSLENSESSNPERSASPLESSSLRSGGVTSAVDVADSTRGDEEDEVSSMRMEGMMRRDTAGFSVVDALDASTTPSVRATTYEDMSCV